MFASAFVTCVSLTAFASVSKEAIIGVTVHVTGQPRPEDRTHFKILDGLRRRSDRSGSLGIGHRVVDRARDGPADATRRHHALVSKIPR